MTEIAIEIKSKNKKIKRIPHPSLIWFSDVGEGGVLQKDIKHLLQKSNQGGVAAELKQKVA